MRAHVGRAPVSTTVPIQGAAEEIGRQRRRGTRAVRMAPDARARGKGYVYTLAGRPAGRLDQENCETLEALDDIREILKYLPHRYPFLMVDRVLSFEKDRSLTAIKNVTFNEPIFTGHFPQAPVFPGVLILEALAQASALLAFKSLGGYPDEKTLYLLVGIDGARFKRQVAPGDRLLFEVDVIKERRGIWKFGAKASVDGVTACTAEVMIARNELDD